VSRRRSHRNRDSSSQGRNRDGSSSHGHHHGKNTAERRHHSEVPPPDRKRQDHAIEKAIGAGSAALYHVRNSPGSWVGGKGLKVIGVASAAALIDYTLDKDSKNHKLQHMAVSMLRSGVTDQILHAGEKDGPGLLSSSHGHH